MLPILERFQQMLWTSLCITDRYWSCTFNTILKKNSNIKCSSTNPHGTFQTHPGSKIPLKKSMLIVLINKDILLVNWQVVCQALDKNCSSSVYGGVQAVLDISDSTYNGKMELYHISTFLAFFKGTWLEWFDCAPWLWMITNKLWD